MIEAPDRGSISVVKPGQYLELLIASLQKFLGPEGVEVRCREQFKADGKITAEIDVTLRTDLGTSKLFWGIECRDRPADGPQGLPWIREIVGKRAQVRPDKMIAVSSTGFTKDAEVFAAEQNIDLITLEVPSEEVLKEWFEVLQFSSNESKYGISDIAKLNFLDPQPKIAAGQLQRMSLNDKVFVRTPDGEPLCLKELIEPKVQRIATCLSAGSRHQVKILIDESLFYLVENARYQIRNLEVPLWIEVRQTVEKVLLNVCRRLSDDKHLALTGVVDFHSRGESVKAIFLVKKELKDGTMSLRVEFFDEKGNRKSLEGVTLSLFGG